MKRGHARAANRPPNRPLAHNTRKRQILLHDRDANEPAFECLLESFDFAAGGRMVRPAAGTVSFVVLANAIRLPSFRARSVAGSSPPPRSTGMAMSPSLRPAALLTSAGER